jgi:superkiller protein 3
MILMKKIILYGGLLLSFLLVLCLPLAAETTLSDGDDLFLQGLYEEAIVAYEEELEMTDDPAPIYSNMASAYYLVEDVDQAVHYFQLAAGAASDSGMPWLSLAVLYELEGDLDAAEEYYLKVTRSTNPLIAVNGYLGSAQLHLEKGDLDGATSRLEEALTSIEGESNLEFQEMRTEIYSTLGYAYVSIGKNEAAFDALTAATQTGTENPIPWVFLGAFLEDTGRYEEALLAYQEATSRDVEAEILALAQESYDSLSVRFSVYKARS